MMAEFSVFIPDDQVARVVDALCVVGGYTGDPDDQKAKREFARQVVIRDIRATVLKVERTQAMADAMTAVTIDPVPID